MLKKMRRLFRIIKYALTQRKNFTLYLIKAEAEEYLEVFGKLGIGCTEDM